jgi:hypothetical protein
VFISIWDTNPQYKRRLRNTGGLAGRGAGQSVSSMWCLAGRGADQSVGIMRCPAGRVADQSVSIMSMSSPLNCEDNFGPLSCRTKGGGEPASCVMWSYVCGEFF